MKPTNYVRRAALIALVALIGVLVYAYSAASVGGGFPLDDSWIHQTYARNLAETGQMAFIPGYPSAGSTAPLYTFILAAGYRLGVDYRVWAYLIGYVGLALTGILSAALADRLFPTVRGVGLWAGLAVVTCWGLLWAAVSSMEIPLSTTLATLILLLAVDQLRGGPTPAQCLRDGALFGLVAALYVATRPEGGLLAALVGLAMLISRPQPTFRHLAAWFIGAAVVGGIGLLPYFALNLSLGNSIFPTTVGAKQAEIPNWIYERGLVINFFPILWDVLLGSQITYMVGLPAAVGYLWRGRGRLLVALPALWFVSLAVLFAWRLPVPVHHGRYLMPALPGLIVVGVGGIVLIVSNRVIFRRSVLVKGVFIMAIAAPITFFVLGYGAVQSNVGAINTEMVQTAKWIAANVPPDQFMATHDIGAIGFFASSPTAPRPLLDVAGLISPEVVPFFFNPQGMADLMQRKNVRWLTLLPDHWHLMWQDAQLPFMAQLCERFNANGTLGGMRVYEYIPSGKCS